MKSKSEHMLHILIKLERQQLDKESFDLTNVNEMWLKLKQRQAELAVTQVHEHALSWSIPGAVRLFASYAHSMRQHEQELTIQMRQLADAREQMEITLCDRLGHCHAMECAAEQLIERQADLMTDRIMTQIVEIAVARDFTNPVARARSDQAASRS